MKLTPQPPPLPGRYLPAVVPLLFCACALWLAARHTVFEEWDGAMHVFAAREIAAGMGYTGWASHFWPPLYPLLILVLSKFMSGFAAGKLISVVSATLLLGVVYFAAREISRSWRVSLVAQLLLATCPMFLGAAIQCENHMLDSLLFTSGVLMLLVALRRRSLGLFLACGVCCALAGMARYTSYILVPAGLLSILAIGRDRRALLSSLLFVAAFLAASSPWLLYNFRVNGSPLATWQYLNIGLAVIPRAWEIGRAQWWWEAQTQFHSIGDVLTAHPLTYVVNFLSNLKASARLLMVSNGVLGAPGLVAALALPWLVERRHWLPLWLVAFGFVGLVCQAFVFDAVFLSFTVFFALATSLLLRALRYWGQDESGGTVSALYTLLLALLLMGNLMSSKSDLTRYLGNANDDGQMVAAEAVGKALQGADPQIATRFVMAINPARAYYAGSGYLCTPLYFKGDDPEALVTYRGLSEEVRRFAPRHPFRPMVDRADYLIYDQGLAHYLPQYAYLMDTKTKRVPPSWKAVFDAPGVVVWQINW